MLDGLSSPSYDELMFMRVLRAAGHVALIFLGFVALLVFVQRLWHMDWPLPMEWFYPEESSL